MEPMLQVGRDNLEISVVETAQAAGEVSGSGANLIVPVEVGSSGSLEQGVVEVQTPTGPLVKGLWGFGLLTLLVSVGTILNKPPHGVLFARHVNAYYLTLAGIFVAGVLEIGAALWVSGARGGGGGGGARRRAFGRVVLWGSVVPLTVVSGIGGYNVLVNLLG